MILDLKSIVLSTQQLNHSMKWDASKTNHHAQSQVEKLSSQLILQSGSALKKQGIWGTSILLCSTMLNALQVTTLDEHTINMAELLVVRTDVEEDGRIVCTESIGEVSCLSWCKIFF